jgi:BirA family biotin operon repressor/biotin-[acetyl-CoA-carboxylase] ligase
MSQEIIRLLRECEGIVSGQRISAELGITRAAVWKRIKTLRKNGFVIKAIPSKGYRLIKYPDLSSDEIMARLRGDFWKKILFYKHLGSTNEQASSLSDHKELDSGSVVIADMQEKGRGRLGRAWFSPPGLNIYMSIILKPEIEPRDSTLITILSSLACAHALRNTSGTEVSIKWPNDLIASGRKIGGILTEVRSDPDRITTAIIGIGVNVNMEAGNFPQEIKAIATSLKNETGRHYSRGDVIAEILMEFEYWYRLLIDKGRAPLLHEWKRLSCTLGKNVRVAAGNKAISGLAEDIDDEGRLLLRLLSGMQQRISAGDLTVL